MFFLKHAIESSFLISIGVLFHSLVAETAKERPPSVSLLYLGQTALMLENLVFTITAEIHARSLVNFYRQYADRHMNLKFM